MHVAVPFSSFNPTLQRIPDVAWLLGHYNVKVPIFSIPSPAGCGLGPRAFVLLTPSPTTASTTGNGTRISNCVHPSPRRLTIMNTNFSQFNNHVQNVDLNVQQQTSSAAPHQPTAAPVATPVTTLADQVAFFSQPEFMKLPDLQNLGTSLDPGTLAASQPPTQETNVHQTNPDALSSMLEFGNRATSAHFKFDPSPFLDAYNGNQSSASNSPPKSDPEANLDMQLDMNMDMDMAMTPTLNRDINVFSQANIDDMNMNMAMAMDIDISTLNNLAKQQRQMQPPTSHRHSYSLSDTYSLSVPQLQSQSQTASQPSALAIDTHFANILDGMQSNMTNYLPSPLDMENLATLPMADSSGSTNLAMDMDIMARNLPAMSQFPTSMSDINPACNHLPVLQFDSPLDTSPMNSAFQNFVFPLSATSQDPLPSNLASPTALAPSPLTQSTVATAQQQRRFSEPHNRSALSPPQASTSAPPSSNLKKKKHSLPTSAQPATINNTTLPWVNPPGGWPSSQQGSKTHVEIPKYKDVYGPSGFDLLGTLVRVTKRPNPKIDLGNVDMSCAFVVCDVKSFDSPIIYCSESFERLTGYTKHEIIGRNCRFLQSPTGQVQAGVKREFTDNNNVMVLKNATINQQETQISLINYRKGGQPFLNLLTIIPIVDDAGEVFQFVGFQVDIVESSGSIDTRKPDGNFLSVDYQRHPTLPAYREPFAEHKLALTQKLQQFLGQADMRTLMQLGQNQLRKASGVGIFDVGHSISREEARKLFRSVAASEELNDINQRSLEKAVLENCDDMIHVLSLKGLFLYVSPACASMLGYQPHELMGNMLSMICHPSDIVPVTRELKESHINTTINMLFRIRRKIQGYTWFESHGTLYTEHNKGRKCLIMTGRLRPVYAMGKSSILAIDGISDYEIWSRMSTTGMFLYVSNHVRQLLDRTPEELVGTNIQNMMRPKAKKDFERLLQVTLMGQSVQVRHEMMNRRGLVHQAITWLYPGDAARGERPTFLVAQTRLLRYSSRGNKLYSTTQAEGQADDGRLTSAIISNTLSGILGGPRELPSDIKLPTSYDADNTAVFFEAAVTQAGNVCLPFGRQDEIIDSDENAFSELKSTRSSSWQYELRQLEKRNRCLAEELHSLQAARKKRKRRRGAGLLQKDCVNCHATSTPEWRRGPSGLRDLCNSCGLRFAKQQDRASPRTPSNQPASVHSDGSRGRFDNDYATSPRQQQQPPLQNQDLEREQEQNATLQDTPQQQQPSSSCIPSTIPEKRAEPDGPLVSQGTPKLARTDSNSSSSSQKSTVPSRPVPTASYWHSGVPHSIQEEAEEDDNGTVI